MRQSIFFDGLVSKLPITGAGMSIRHSLDYRFRTSYYLSNIDKGYICVNGDFQNINKQFDENWSISINSDYSYGWENKDNIKINNSEWNSYNVKKTGFLYKILKLNENDFKNPEDDDLITNLNKEFSINEVHSLKIFEDKYFGMWFYGKGHVLVNL